MNFIDKIVNYIDPVKGLMRSRARSFMAVSSNYTSASRERRSLKQWKTTTDDADKALEYDLGLLRERSHDLLRNSPLASGIVGNAVTNIIGQGIRLQSRINRKVLKIDDVAAKEWESKTELEFSLWGDSQECDISKLINFYEIQNLVMREVFSGGDSFIILPYVSKAGAMVPYRLRLQVVDAGRVCNQNHIKNGQLDNNYIFEGIERDKNGVPVRYHISNGYSNSTRSQSDQWTKVDAFRRNGLRNVIHLYKVLRPGQSRGIPFLAPVIESIKQITRYTEAEIDAAVVSGLFTVFVKSESGDAGFSIEKISGETGARGDDDDIKLSSGAVVELAPGEDIVSANPGRPNNAFDPFVSAILRQIGVALEIPFEVLVKHFTSSYSAARAAMLEAWRFFLCRRQWLADNFCQVVYEVWMWEAVALGRIIAPGFFEDPLIRKAWLGSEWTGPAQGQIDPVKEVEAAGKRIGLGLSTTAQETMALTGGDFESNIAQIRKERELLREAGLIDDHVSGKGDEKKEDEQNNEDKTIDDGIEPDEDLQNDDSSNKTLPSIVKEPVNIPINISIDVEKKDGRKSIKIISDEKGRVIGAEMSEEDK